MDSMITPTPHGAVLVRKAYSYARFSNPSQADGRSLERQLEAARDYCQRHRLDLDERGFLDRGKSGYTGANATAGDLAEFIRLIEDGRVPKGSVLIVENTDRLSRLPADQASALITRIVRAGID